MVLIGHLSTLSKRCLESVSSIYLYGYCIGIIPFPHMLLRQHNTEERAWLLELYRPVFKSWLCHLGKSRDFFKPEFPYILNEDNNTYLTSLFYVLSEITYKNT